MCISWSHNFLYLPFYFWLSTLFLFGCAYFCSFLHRWQINPQKCLKPCCIIPKCNLRLPSVSLFFWHNLPGNPFGTRATCQLMWTLGYPSVIYSEPMHLKTLITQKGLLRQCIPQTYIVKGMIDMREARKLCRKTSWKNCEKEMDRPEGQKCDVALTRILTCLGC